MVMPCQVSGQAVWKDILDARATGRRRSLFRERRARGLSARSKRRERQGQNGDRASPAPKHSRPRSPLTAQDWTRITAIDVFFLHGTTPAVYFQIQR